MDKLRVAVATAAERFARSRRLLTLRAFLDPTREGDHGQHGQGLAEYALILAGIAIVAIASLLFLGNSITGLFEDIINNGFRYVQDVLNP
jgi:Flp pilus assembly pilin Flp